MAVVQSAEVLAVSLTSTLAVVINNTVGVGVRVIHLSFVLVDTYPQFTLLACRTGGGLQCWAVLKLRC